LPISDGEADADATCTSLTVDGAARCRSPVLAHVLQDVLPRTGHQCTKRCTRTRCSRPVGLTASKSSPARCGLAKIDTIARGTSCISLRSRRDMDHCARSFLIFLASMYAVAARTVRRYP